jgi:hypothetical protein
LNQPWIVARRDDAAEIAGVDDLPGVRIDAADGVEVTGWIGKVHVIEEIKELGAELDVL